jgi:hypothetical protein
MLFQACLFAMIPTLAEQGDKKTVTEDAARPATSFSPATLNLS